MKNILNNLAIKHVNSNFKLTYNQKQPFLLVNFFTQTHIYVYIIITQKKKNTFKTEGRGENRQRDKSAQDIENLRVSPSRIFFYFSSSFFFPPPKHHFKRLDFFMFSHVSGRKFKGALWYPSKIREQNVHDNRV